MLILPLLFKKSTLCFPVADVVMAITFAIACAVSLPIQAQIPLIEAQATSGAALPVAEIPDADEVTVITASHLTREPAPARFVSLESENTPRIARRFPTEASGKRTTSLTTANIESVPLPTGYAAVVPGVTEYETVLQEKSPKDPVASFEAKAEFDKTIVHASFANPKGVQSSWLISLIFGISGLALVGLIVWKTQKKITARNRSRQRRLDGRRERRPRRPLRHWL